MKTTSKENEDELKKRQPKKSNNPYNSKLASICTLNPTPFVLHSQFLACLEYKWVRSTVTRAVLDILIHLYFRNACSMNWVLNKAILHSFIFASFTYHEMLRGTQLVGYRSTIFWSERVRAPSASFRHDGTTIIIDFFSSFFLSFFLSSFFFLPSSPFFQKGSS